VKNILHISAIAQRLSKIGKTSQFRLLFTRWCISTQRRISMVGGPGPRRGGRPHVRI